LRAQDQVANHKAIMMSIQASYTHRQAVMEKDSCNSSRWQFACSSKLSGSQ